MKSRSHAKPGAQKVSPAVRQRTRLAPSRKFDEVLALIEAARRRAYQAVNTELVNLYWQLGEYISKKIASAEWGDGVVVEYALARTASPTLVAEYQTALPSKALLCRKLHELYAQREPAEPQVKGRRP